MITQTPPLPTMERTTRTGRALLAALAVGAVVGPLDLALQHLLASPWARLAHSNAIWAVVAFALGWVVSGWVRSGRRWWQPALVGAVALVVAIETYDLAAVLVLGDDPSTLVNPTARVWVILAVAAGVVFGTAGAWARAGLGWRAPVGTAFAPAVLFAEAAVDAHRAAAVFPRQPDDLIQIAVILVALGLVAGVLAGRDPRSRLHGLVLSLPLTAVGTALFVILSA